MKRQRGFGLIIYAVMALAILGALAGLYALVDNSWETSAGIERGEANKQAEWVKANREAQAAADELKHGDELLAQQKAAELLKANQDAEGYKRKYEAERAQRKREKHPQVFANCSKQQNTGGSNEQQAKDTDVTPTLRLSWGFVREWDGAWTGQTGQPVFGLQLGGTGAGEQPDTPSPLSIDDLSDNHAANAALCSTDRRRLNALTDKIKALQQRWQSQ